MQSGQEIRLPIPTNSDTGLPLGPSDIRPLIIPKPETTQVKCRVCEGMTEQSWFSVIPVSQNEILEASTFFMCINCGTITRTSPPKKKKDD